MDVSDGSIWGPTESAPRRPRRDDRFTCRVEALEERGRARGTVGPYTVQFGRATPGARVEGRVKRRRRNRVDADVMAVLEPAAEAVEPRCVHFGECGGCSFQDLAYPAQLTELGRLLDRQLTPLGLGSIGTPEPSPAEFGYRNKMDFTFSAQRWIERREVAGATLDKRDDFAVGLHVRARHDKVLDIEGCALQFAGGDDILGTVRELSLASGLGAWDTRDHGGYLRHLVLRHGVHSGETMAHLVTSGGSPPAFDALCSALCERHPELTTLVHSETDRLSTVAVGERQAVRYGPGAIEDSLLGRRFRISADSFFQTNTRAAELLFGWVRDQLDQTESGGVLYDLYCGAGAIGLVLADRFERVIGLELVEAAVVDARANATLNGIEHAEFHAGDVLTHFAGDHGLPRPDVAVVDPPRAGLHADVVAELVRVAPAQVLYISCNPLSAARDLPPLLSGGYTCRAARAFDLFPHTPHLEVAFHLVRGEATAQP